jgi:two-component system, NtrC family, response regulator HydG
MANILLIEDDLTYSRIIKNFLTNNGFEVKSFHKITDAQATLKSFWADLLITDFRLPDGNGLEVLEAVLGLPNPVPVILITSYSDIRIAVKAMKMGAFEYITKPINPDELLITVKEALAKDEKPTTKTAAPSSSGLDYITGQSENSKRLEEHISLVAPTDLSVLILGDTGTGKEYIAKRIHQLSQRNSAPFVAIDCGALSPELAGSELFGHVKGSFTGATDNKTGHFESAKGGTIFLDEIGNLSYDVQVKLLRAIQERRIRKIGGNQEVSIDVRIVAATNDDLKSNNKDGSFREDLYHRLNEFTLKVLPLRERKEDLMVFANHFLLQSNSKLGKNVKGFSQEVREWLISYPWPGNLRELKNIIRRAVLLCQEDYIQKKLLPADIVEIQPVEEIKPEIDAASFRETQMLQEKEVIQKTLHEVRYNKSKAAKILGIDRKTLYNKMEKYGLE